MLFRSVNDMAKKDKKDTTKSGVDKPIQPAESGQALSPFEEMERWFESHYPRGWMRPFHRDWPTWGDFAAPFESRMPKDLDVSVSENSVTIKGETSHETKEEKGDYVRSELSRGTFSRMVSLPGTVDAEKAKATFKDGILELSLPKVEKSKRKSVAID